MKGRNLHHLFLRLAMMGCMATPAAAEDDPPAGTLRIELNAAQDVEGACRISFVAENRLGADIARAVFEAVLFDSDGVVERLTLFDFRDLPRGRPRVRQFQIDGQACASIGRILINGAQTCDGADLADGACTERLDLTSRTAIDLIG